MYGNNDYRDYLEHANFKYLEKIKDGAKTRYFYTREQLQGYYNSLRNNAHGLASRAVAGAKSNARQIERAANRQVKRLGRKVRTSDIATSWRKNEGVPGVVKRAGIRTRNAVTNLRGSVPGAIYRGKKSAKSRVLNAWNSIVSGAKNVGSTVRRKTQAAGLRWKNRKDQSTTSTTTFKNSYQGIKSKNKERRELGYSKTVPSGNVHEIKTERERGIYASRKPRSVAGSNNSSTSTNKKSTKSKPKSNSTWKNSTKTVVYPSVSGPVVIKQSEKPLSYTVNKLVEKRATNPNKEKFLKAWRRQDRRR